MKKVSITEAKIFLPAFRVLHAMTPHPGSSPEAGAHAKPDEPHAKPAQGERAPRPARLRKPEHEGSSDGAPLPH